MAGASAGPDCAARQEFVDFFSDEIATAGGEVLLAQRGVDLCVDETGAVNGAVLCARDGVKTRVGARPSSSPAAATPATPR